MINSFEQIEAAKALRKVYETLIQYPKDKRRFEEARLSYHEKHNEWFNSMKKKPLFKVQK